MEEIIFPNQIRMFRRIRGITMKELADSLSISLSAVSKIEKGYRRLDTEQLEKISSLLDCPVEDLLVTETSSHPDIIASWEREKERRNKVNEGSGLKTLGAGLRYLRAQKGLTLLDVAKGAGLTLSVYHRIEMGQREVSEKEFSHIARALGYEEQDLQIQIYELDMAGNLQELKEAPMGKRKALCCPRGGYNDLPINRFIVRRAQGSDALVNVYGKKENDEVMLIDKAVPTGKVVCPSDLASSEEVYGVPYLTPTLGHFFSQKAVFIVDPTQSVQENDFALYYEDNTHARFVSVQGKAIEDQYALQLAPEKKIPLTLESGKKLHRVVLIIFP